jgi:transcriptional regulator with PAS, ATPase and Fis domain
MDHYKNRLPRIPATWKFGLLFVILACIQIGGISFLLHPEHLAHGAPVPPWFWTRVSEALSLIFITEGLIILTAFLYFKKFVTRINKELKHVLHERRLENNLSSFYQAKTLPQIVQNIHNLFGLFKSFDHMKASRINVETQSLKAILNNIQEGIVLVNTDRVVTHINHRAESMLRLLPGEIIEQSISRKVSCPTILDIIARTISEDHKFLNVAFCVREETPLSLDSYPIKNTFGEVIRVVVIIRESSP